MKPSFNVLRHEAQADFDTLLASFREEFHPETPHESFLVELMAQSRWRIARLAGIEAATFDALVLSGADPRHTPESLIAFKLGNGAGANLATLQRLISAAERTYFKAQTELHRYRQSRKEADTVATLDATVVKRVVNAPPSRRETPVPVAPQSRPELRRPLVMSANDNPALRL